MAQIDLNYGSSANDGTGDGLRDTFIKVQSNFDELYNFKFGIYNYDHAGSTQAISTTTWTHVLNDGAGANTILTCVYPDVDIYDTTLSLLDFTDLTPCDSVDIRFDSNITTTTPNQNVLVRLILSYGVLNIPLAFIDRSYKNSGTYPLFGSVRADVLSASVNDNPARFEIYSDASCTLDVNGWNVKVNKIIQA